MSETTTKREPREAVPAVDWPILNLQCLKCHEVFPYQMGEGDAQICRKCLGKES